MRGNESLKTLDHALSLLDFLSCRSDDIGVTEAARQLGISKTAAHRITQTLAARGFLKQDPVARRYHLGLKCWEVGCQAVVRLGMRDAAFPFLEELSRETGETAYLAVYENGHVIWVEIIDPPKTIRIHTRLGERVPAHCVSAGKAILAFRPWAEVEPLLSDLKRHTPVTVVDPRAFTEDLARIRQSGYAVVRGEWKPELIGVGAPICDRRGQAVASVAVSAPMSYISNSFEADIAPTVLRAAGGISAALGYLRPVSSPYRSAIAPGR